MANKILRLEEQIQLINQTKTSKEHLTKAINVSQAQCEAKVEKVQSNLTNWKLSQVKLRLLKFNTTCLYDSIVIELRGLFDSKVEVTKHYCNCISESLFMTQRLEN